YLTATDLADYLAAKGMPFREAHGVVGRLVARAIGRGVALHELPLAEMREESALIEDDVYRALDVRRSVESRESFGGTASREVAKQTRRARKALAPS
ncbi:MAG: argininosuccinate lyase, partial [Myxococcales bacterium]|nr:argininosuccinate lyase [Myxococcales bacterium]